MLGFIVGILIFIASTLLGVVSSKTPFFSLKKKNIEVYKSGWQFFGLIVFIVVLFWVQNYLNQIDIDNARKGAIKANKESEDRIRSDYSKSVERITHNYNEKTKDLKHTYDSSASVLRNKYDTSTTNIVKALAEYGLTYNKRTDSVEKLIKSNRSPEPDLTFCEDDAFSFIDTTKDIIRVRINFCSYKATSSNINIVCYLVYHLKDGSYLYGGTTSPLPKNSSIAAEKGTGIPMLLSKEFCFYSQDLWIIAKGSHTNKDGTKSYPLYEVAGYDIATKKNGGVTTYKDDKIKETLAAAGIKL